MVNECGITLYFRNDRIHIRKRTVEVLNHPAYVQLFINEGKKQLFIQSSTKNKDAFRVYYKPESKKKRVKKLEILCRWIIKQAVRNPKEKYVLIT